MSSTRAPGYCLTEVSGAHGAADARTVELSPQELVVGRAEDADLVFGVPTVSRHHAALWLQDGIPHVKDLGSGHGTFVNSVRIDQPTALRQGDLVSLGHDVVLVVSARSGVLQPSSAYAPPPPPLEAAASSLVELALTDTAATRQNRPYLEALVDLGLALEDAPDETAVLETVLGTLQRVLNAERLVALLANDASQLHLVTELPPPSHADGRPTAPLATLLEQAAQLRQPVLAYDTSFDERFRDRSGAELPSARSALCVGLHGPASCLGALYAENHGTPGAFTLDDGRFCQAAAQLVTIELLRRRPMQEPAEAERAPAPDGDGRGLSETDVAAMAADLRSHLNRLELIANDLEHEHGDQPIARLLIAEADRLRADLERYDCWGTREATRIGMRSELPRAAHGAAPVLAPRKARDY